ncbi:MAG: archaellin/type IV pilin N-terminal domain-containing protein [Candidatus Aenigmatarchaeota archaeon]
MTRKGISPIIAIVLLLMITISMVGFAYVWFTRITGSAFNQSRTEQENIQKQQGQRVIIDNILGNQLTLRHVGTYPVTKDELGVFINGVATSITSGCDTINPGEYKTCTLATSCTSGSRIRVTSPGMTDEQYC